MNRELWIVTQDDELLASCKTEQAAWAFVHGTTSFSVDHATRHEGFRITRALPFKLIPESEGGPFSIEGGQEIALVPVIGGPSLFMMALGEASREVGKARRVGAYYIIETPKGMSFFTAWKGDA